MSVYQAFILWLTSGHPMRWEYTNNIQQRFYVLCKFKSPVEWQNNRLDITTLYWGMTCRATYELFDTWRLTLYEYTGRHVLAPAHQSFRDVQRATFAHTSVCKGFLQTSTGVWRCQLEVYARKSDNSLIRTLYWREDCVRERSKLPPGGPVRWNVAKAMVGDQAWEDEDENSILSQAQPAQLLVKKGERVY